MVFFILDPSLAAEKQGLGLTFSIENENFKPRMKISIENENFVRGGMVFFFFSCVRARMNFFDPRALSAGIFPICPYSLSRPFNFTKSTYEEQSRKGPRHNPDLSGKKVGNPPVWKLPVYLLSNWSQATG